MLNNVGSFISTLSCCPSSIDNLFFLINKTLNPGRNTGFQYGLGDINHSDYIGFENLNKILDEAALELLNKETIAIGNSFLLEYGEIENYINQLDEIDLDL